MQAENKVSDLDKIVEISLAQFQYVQCRADSFRSKEEHDTALKYLRLGAAKGYANSQSFLGSVYLTDPVIKDTSRAIYWLKKAVDQRNGNAWTQLRKMGIDYPYPAKKDLARDKKPRYPIIILIIIYFALALIIRYTVDKSSHLTPNRKNYLINLTWLVPILGGVYAYTQRNKITFRLDRNRTHWIISKMDWLYREFGAEIFSQEVLIPNREHFPVYLDNSKDGVANLVGFIAEYMGTDPKQIKVKLYGKKQQIGYGSIATVRRGESYASGYFNTRTDGAYEIGIEASDLENFVGVIRTIAHEISHIKLLGEKRIKENDEHLTDLVPIAFGLGIFVANSSFQYDQSSYGWQYSSRGYLNDREIGFALAYYVHLRDDSQSAWSYFLTKSVQEEFERGLIYLKKKGSFPAAPSDPN